MVGLISSNCVPKTDFLFLAVFYGGYGVILCPSLGVLESYGGATPEYHNALGFYVLSLFKPVFY